MEEITFRLRTITPLFMAGADQNEAELRPPSMKGVLRFWYRTIVGKEGLKNEKEIFGSVETGQGAFLIRIEKQPSIETSKKQVGQGIAYLGYGPITHGKIERSYIKANESFEISFLIKNPNCKVEILKSFWLLVNFGGLGSRSRRGFGSVQVQKVIGDTGGIVFVGDTKTPSDLRDYLNDGLKAIFDKNKPSARLFPDFSAFSKETRIWLYFTNGENWEKAMENVGQNFQNFRSNKVKSGPRPFPHDYNSIKSMLEEVEANSKLSTLPVTKPPDRVIFGLPHNYFFSSRTKWPKQANFGWEDGDRRASPLMFHISKLGDEEYVCVFTYLKANFLPAGKKITVSLPRDKNRKRKGQVDIPWDRAIFDFIKYLKIPKNMEVSIP